MPRYTATTTITTDRGESLTASKAGNYEDVFNIRQEVDNSNAFIDMINVGTSIAAQTLRDAKKINIKNNPNLSNATLGVIDSFFKD